MQFSKKNIIFILLFVVGVANSYAAAIRGKVRLRQKGNFPSVNPYVKDVFKTDLRFATWRLKKKFDSVHLRNYQDPTETIVYLSKVPEQYKLKEVPPQEPITICIEGAMLHPRTLPVLAGSTVEFINKDPVAHDVYSFSAAKPFQTPFFLEKKAYVTLKEAGGVSLKSSIYKDMKGEILVLDHPYFTKPAEDGYYSMRNIRPGIYQITAWHPDFPPITKEVEVNYGETITIDFNLSTIGLPEALVR